jgi:hypothetical protein
MIPLIPHFLIKDSVEMTTGYEKILALIHKKTHEEVSGYQTSLTNEKYLGKGDTLSGIGEVSGGSVRQISSNSLVQEDGEWIKNVVELAVTGQLAEPVPVSVKLSYQHIIGEGVWFCPDQETACDKAPDLAFIPEELPIIIPLIIENEELASTLISAKRIFRGTIMDSSLLDLSTAEFHDGEVGSDDKPQPGEAAPLDQDTSTHQDGGENQTSRKCVPSPGRHHVIIRTVKAYLHNFPEYTGPRARMEMEILQGSDSGKILVDNISLPHPYESKGMERRRLLIAKRLGLIIRGPNGEAIQRGSWKLLEGVVCWVDVAYKILGGRKVLTVDNYEPMENDAHTQPAHSIHLAGAKEGLVVEEHPEPAPSSTPVTLPAVQATTFLNTSGSAFTCVDCSHFEANHGPNPRQGWGRCSKRNRGRYGCATACEALELVEAHGGKVEVQH